MTVRVRFAPAPTGHLHIGGARTALYDYLYARAKNGVLVLRIEDTDQERSKKEYEDSLVKDLKWLGIDYDEGPDKPGKFGPYRQSERLDIYQQCANQLITEDKAFYCFCTEQELEEKKLKAKEKGLDPRYDGTCRLLSPEDVTKRLKSGEKATIRFNVPEKTYRIKDYVRGEVTFPEGMVGDFVVLRSNGLPVYNFCCMVDDWKMEISHVIRAEDHLPNTLRQMMLYEAFNVNPPEFAHVSLLIGKDRQKLSKRHGATSINSFKDEGYLSEAMVNYLCLLGWSHPEEKDIFSLDEIEGIFEINRFSKPPALFDIEKLNWLNGQHIKRLSKSTLIKDIEQLIPVENRYHQQTEQWKEQFIELCRDKLHFVHEVNQYLNHVFDEHVEETEQLKEIYSWPTTPQIKDYLREEVNKLVEKGICYVQEGDFSLWTNHIKNTLKVKGKPLFMGMRVVLTGKDHGPDLKTLIYLTPLKTIKARIG